MTQSSSQRSQISLRNQVESPLLRLPAELRNKIYSYVCGTACAVAFINPKWSTEWRMTNNIENLNESCAQLRHETEFLLNSATCLIMPGWNTLYLMTVGDHFKMTVDLKICSMELCGDTVENMLKMLTNVYHDPWICRRITQVLPNLELVLIPGVFYSKRHDEEMHKLVRWLQDGFGYPTRLQVLFT